MFSIKKLFLFIILRTLCPSFNYIPLKTFKNLVRLLTEKSYSKSYIFCSVLKSRSFFLMWYNILWIQFTNNIKSLYTTPKFKIQLKAIMGSRACKQAFLNDAYSPKVLNDFWNDILQVKRGKSTLPFTYLWIVARIVFYLLYFALSDWPRYFGSFNTDVIKGETRVYRSP